MLMPQSTSTISDSHELLKGVFATIKEAVFIVSSENREIIDLNISAEKMFGYSREEMIGAKTSILHLDNEMYLKFGEMMTKSYQDKGFFETTYRMKRKDGSYFPSEHSVRPITFVDDLCTSHVCVVQDISEQVSRVEELYSLAQQLDTRNYFVESVFTNLKSGIIVVNRDYKILMLNHYVAELSGEPSEAHTGKNLADICPELHAALLSGISDGEIPVKLFDRKQVVGFAKFDLQGGYKGSDGYIINFKDLTEIIKIRRQLRHKERLSAMGEVVANVAHEMRNPLFAMTTVAQIFAMELMLTPAQKELMNSMLKESKRLNDLVEELLDSTRELRLQRKNIDLNSVITESFRVLEAIPHSERLIIRKTTYAEKIPLNADFEKLEQVVINLVKNAMEASPDNSFVDLNIEEGVGGVIISVIDSGTGISPGAMEKIFEVFYTTKKNGTGLGLSICKNIIEAHGGSLEACNNPEVGATFTIKLPFGGDE